MARVDTTNGSRGGANLCYSYCGKYPDCIRHEAGECKNPRSPLYSPRSLLRMRAPRRR